MEKCAISEIDAWMPTVVKDRASVVRNMAEIVGTDIGVKMVAMDCFLPEEREKVDFVWFRRKLHEMGLHVVFERRALGGSDPWNFAEYYYLGKTRDIALTAQSVFHKIWSGEWEMNGEIGKLLGYPATAVDYFLRKKGEMSEDDKSRMARNRFYVHSPEFEDEEFEAYEKKIYKVIAEKCPETWKILTSDKMRRWE